MSFTYTSHTSEIGFTVNAPTLEGLFVETGRAVTHIMTEDTIQNVMSHAIAVAAESLEAVYFEFLNELVVLLDTEAFFVASGDLHMHKQDDSWVIEGHLHGDLVSEYEHHGDVKAPTYHKLYIKELDDGSWESHVLMDI